MGTVVKTYISQLYLILHIFSFFCQVQAVTKKIFTFSENSELQVIWLVFLVSLLGRGICLFYSRRAILHRRSGRVVTCLGRCERTWRHRDV